MDKLNILHLSDLHYKIESKDDINIVFKALLDDLKNYFEIKLNLIPDFIIFSGDIIFEGDKGYGLYNHYEESYNNFIKPLLDYLNIDKNRLFICPGNHDIERLKIDNLIEAGLKVELNDPKKVNNLLDNIKQDFRPFVRLENFNKFINSIHDNNPYLVKSNGLYSTYSFILNDLKIGIACLNTAWRAYGDDIVDKGNLLLGERQFDWAIDDLKDSNFKILNIHHPINWLKTFDSRHLKFLIPKYFDMLFYGHIHDLNSEFVISPAGNIAVSSSGSIFEGRQFEGYSLVSYDFIKKNIIVYYRKYNNLKYNFISAEEIIDNGFCIFDVSPTTKESTTRAITILKDCYEDVKKELCEDLIIYKTETIAPKDFSDIVVSPNLSQKPEYYHNADDEDDTNKYQINLDDLINSDDNIVFYGFKESGKSTILNTFLYYYIEHKIKGKFLLPIKIDFKSLTNSKRAILNSIYNYLYNSQRVDIEYLLNNGNCIILIDNINLDDKIKISHTIDFINNFKNNRYIFTRDEELFNSLDIDDLNLNIPLKKVFIRSFGSKQIRLLIDNWFRNKKVDTKEIHESIIDLLKKIKIPSTPFVISIFLWIYETNEHYTPINEATLIENFILDILQKLRKEDIKSEKIDYKIKQDFLSYIAHYMIVRDQYLIKYNDFEDITRNYFNKRLLTVNISMFLNELFFRGIFSIKQNNVKFRFNCFLTYFAALRIEEDQNFYKYILQEINYLKYSDEINFYTGLNRKNEEVLSLIKNRLIDSFKDIKRQVNFDDLKRFEIDNCIFDGLELESLEKSKPTKEEINGMYDRSSIKLIKHDQDIIRKEYHDYTKYFIENLELFSKILKNSELIENDKLKKESYEICIEYYGLLTILMMDYASKIKLSHIKKDEDIDYNELRHFLTIIIPVIIQSFMFFILGSKKLDQLIYNNLRDKKNILIKFFNLYLYSDLKLTDYMLFIKENVHVASSKIFLELSAIKLQQYYFFRELSKKDETILLNILSEIKLKLQGMNKMYKSKFIDMLKKKKKDRSFRQKDPYSKLY